MNKVKFEIQKFFIHLFVSVCYLVCFCLILLIEKNWRLCISTLNNFLYYINHWKHSVSSWKVEKYVLRESKGDLQVKSNIYIVCFPRNIGNIAITCCFENSADMSLRFIWPLHYIKSELKSKLISDARIKTV